MRNIANEYREKRHLRHQRETVDSTERDRFSESLIVNEQVLGPRHRHFIVDEIETSLSESLESRVKET